MHFLQTILQAIMQAKMSNHLVLCNSVCRNCAADYAKHYVEIGCKSCNHYAQTYVEDGLLITLITMPKYVTNDAYGCVEHGLLIMQKYGKNGAPLVHMLMSKMAL